MSAKTLTIDGKMLTGVAGETVFTVAWHNGIQIPRLCHLGGVSDVGACRLCLVEIDGRTKLSASCMTPIEEGMVVRTDTEELREHRKLLLELLLAEGNHVCAVCVSNGNCELQDLATELGIDHVRVPYRHPKREVDLSHERFGLDHNRCVACTRCVRTCDEVEGAHVWDMANRGEKLKVVADLGEPWGASQSCTDCGKCVQVCPTGALFTKGMAVGEMKKDRGFLKYVVYGRERQQWVKKP
jgi:bidirectional [NiFe] hydrogenase diaphorase subunit